MYLTSKWERQIAWSITEWFIANELSQQCQRKGNSIKCRYSWFSFFFPRLSTKNKPIKGVKLPPGNACAQAWYGCQPSLVSDNKEGTGPDSPHSVENLLHSAVCTRRHWLPVIYLNSLDYLLTAETKTINKRKQSGTSILLFN